VTCWEPPAWGRPKCNAPQAARHGGRFEAGTAGVVTGSGGYLKPPLFPPARYTAGLPIECAMSAS
jgi:hypothetical protein